MARERSPGSSGEQDEAQQLRKRPAGSQKSSTVRHDQAQAHVFRCSRQPRRRMPARAGGCRGGLRGRSRQGGGLARDQADHAVRRHAGARVARASAARALQRDPRADRSPPQPAPEGAVRGRAPRSDDGLRRGSARRRRADAAHQGRRREEAGARRTRGRLSADVGRQRSRSNSAMVRSSAEPRSMSSISSSTWPCGGSSAARSITFRRRSSPASRS